MLRYRRGDREQPKFARTKWEDYEKMVRSMAACLALNSLDRQDLFAVGREAWLKARDSYVNDRGASFRTHLYWQVKGAMEDFLRRSNRTPHIDAEIPVSRYGHTNPTQESSYFVTQLLAKLPEDAVEIIKIIFNAPSELIQYIGVNRNGGILRSNHGIRPRTIERYMVAERGWQYVRVWNAIKSIKQALKGD